GEDTGEDGHADARSRLRHHVVDGHRPLDGLRRSGVVRHPGLRATETRIRPAVDHTARQPAECGVATLMHYVLLGRSLEGLSRRLHLVNVRCGAPVPRTLDDLHPTCAARTTARSATGP